MKVFKTILREYFFLIPVILITVILFRTVLFLGIVPTQSMEPTLDVGAGIFATKINTDSLKRGDVIVFHPPIKGRTSQIWVKRVIGLPGDTVRLKEHDVYVNGNKLSEPYVNGTADYSEAEYKVPQGSVFVMGDNRNNSLDARYWGVHALPEENIIGKVRLRFVLKKGCKSGIGPISNSLRELPVNYPGLKAQA